ncbi:MAG: two-component regulator propeller domain-containing protein [Methanococcaceae archaeon]
MKTSKIIFVLLLLTSAAFSQKLGTWKNYSNMKQVNAAVFDGTTIWAVTNGGAFGYNTADSAYIQLTKAAGLSTNSVTAVVKDKNGRVWFGSQEGFIDVYDTNENRFIKKILDIANTNKSRKQINELKIKGDTVFAATDFGLSLININNFSFIDTYLKLGTLSTDTKVISSFYNGLMYVATENGIARQKNGTTNLSAPESWNNFSLSTGIQGDSVIKIANYKDSVIAATPRGLFIENGNIWSPFLPQFQNITDIYSHGDTLFIVTPHSVAIYNNSKVSNPFPVVNDNLNRLAASTSNFILVASNNGIVKIPAFTFGNTYYYPEGPASNIFAGMSVDQTGTLWAGSGSGSAAVGFYKYSNEKWTNYSKFDIPNAKSNQYFEVFSAPDNTIYFQNWGDGFTRLKDNKFKVFNTSNTPLMGIAEAPNFLVISGIATDSKGNLWTLTYREANKKPLAKLGSDSTWTTYTNSNLIRNILQAYDLVIDRYDTKWFTLSKIGASTGDALYYYNENRAISTDADNGWGVLSVESGINSENINAIALDDRDELWIGTSAGINIIPDVSNPLQGMTSVNIMRTQVVTCIAVDALNQKWVGTQQGVFVLSPDGFKLVANYNTSNSPLTNDVIKSIAIDNITGTVYIGTDFGLTSVTTTSVRSSEALTDMFIYPNPAVISKDSPVSITIEGLVKDTDIKVLSISGKEIITFTSPGAGVAVWDGKDANGQYVATGVYLIVAYDRDGTNVGAAKVAVLRK